MGNEMLELVYDDFTQGAQDTIAAYKKQLTKIRTGRATTSLLDDIRADFYGTPTPISQMANITVPEPRMIVVVPYDTGTLKEMEKAIISSELGLNPQNDGKVLRLVIPTLTEERRRELTKVAGKITEDHRVSIRKARKESIDTLKQMEKDKEISEDDNHRAQKDIQKQVDETIAKIDEIAKAKEKEIMEV